MGYLLLHIYYIPLMGICQPYFYIIFTESQKNIRPPKRKADINYSVSSRNTQCHSCSCKHFLPDTA